VQVDAVLMIGEALHRFTHVRLACALLSVAGVCGGVCVRRGRILINRCREAWG
jgi:hypothetical protein